MAASEFKKRALPIHANLTRTPPSEDESAPTDSGFLTAVALQPTSFNTGSYGWKGSRRLTIEIDAPDGGKEKVQVMLQYVFSLCALWSRLGSARCPWVW